MQQSSKMTMHNIVSFIFLYITYVHNVQFGVVKGTRFGNSIENVIQLLLICVQSDFIFLSHKTNILERV